MCAWCGNPGIVHGDNRSTSEGGYESRDCIDNEEDGDAQDN